MVLLISIRFFDAQKKRRGFQTPSESLSLPPSQTGAIVRDCLALPESGVDIVIMGVPATVQTRGDAFLLCGDSVRDNDVACLFGFFD